MVIALFILFFMVLFIPAFPLPPNTLGRVSLVIAGTVPRHRIPASVNPVPRRSSVGRHHHVALRGRLAFKQGMILSGALSKYAHLGQCNMVRNMVTFAKLGQLPYGMRYGASMQYGTSMQYGKNCNKAIWSAICGKVCRPRP